MRTTIQNSEFRTYLQLVSRNVIRMKPSCSIAESDDFRAGYVSLMNAFILRVN